MARTPTPRTHKYGKTIHPLCSLLTPSPPQCNEIPRLDTISASLYGLALFDPGHGPTPFDPPDPCELPSADLRTAPFGEGITGPRAHPLPNSNSNVSRSANDSTVMSVEVVADADGGGGDGGGGGGGGEEVPVTPLANVSASSARAASGPALGVDTDWPLRPAPECSCGTKHRAQTTGTWCPDLERFHEPDPVLSHRWHELGAFLAHDGFPGDLLTR